MGEVMESIATLGFALFGALFLGLLMFIFFVGLHVVVGWL